jgi:hypothetical protein
MGKFLIVIQTFLIIFCVAAQSDDKVRVRFVPFDVRDLSQSEAVVIESLILSYISDIDGIYVSTAPESDDSEPEPIYVLSGSIYFENDNHVLRLTMDNLSTGEKTEQISAYKTSGDMALKVRGLVEDYFSIKDQERSVADDTLSARDVTGTWHGDNGIELVRFAPNGRAFAIFSSGISMELSYTIENNTLNITQESPNSFRYFYPLPSSVAKEIEREAKPMRWTMSLFNSGKLLRGINIWTSAEYEPDNTVKSIIHGKVRRSEWKKFSY